MHTDIIWFLVTYEDPRCIVASSSVGIIALNDTSLKIDVNDTYIFRELPIAMFIVSTTYCHVSFYSE